MGVKKGSFFSTAEREYSPLSRPVGGEYWRRKRPLGGGILRGVTKKGNRDGGKIGRRIHRFIASLSSLQELPSKIPPKRQIKISIKRAWLKMADVFYFFLLFR